MFSIFLLVVAALLHIGNDLPYKSLIFTKTGKFATLFNINVQAPLL